MRTSRSTGEVVSIEPEADPVWDRFVHRTPGATAYHLAAWSQILARSYRFEPAHLALRDDGGAIRGILPLLAKHGPVSGRRLRSLPVVPAGGPLSDEPAGALRLMEHACRLAAGRRSVLAVESRISGLDADLHGLRLESIQPSWVLRLPSEKSEADWLARRSKNMRRSIARARRSGLSVRLTLAERDLRGFYELYLGTMRGHRFLPRLYRQLRLARQALQPSGVFRLFLVEDAGRLVAGGVFHTLGDTIELLYNASDRGALGKRPNHLLYHHVIGWARDHGLTKLDFGGAWPNTSLGEFKAQWGAELVAEHRYVYGGRAQGLTAGPVGARQSPAAVGRRLEGVWDRVPMPLLRAASLLAYRYL